MRERVRVVSEVVGEGVSEVVGEGVSEGEGEGGE